MPYFQYQSIQDLLETCGKSLSFSLSKASITVTVYFYNASGCKNQRLITLYRLIIKENDDDETIVLLFLSFALCREAKRQVLNKEQWDDSKKHKFEKILSIVLDYQLLHLAVND